MLQNIRDKATGWVAYIIIGLITIPFLFWGIQSYLGVGGSATVATVNDTEIPVQEFQRELQQHQRQLREMFGGKVPAELAEGPAIKQSVLGKMIQREVLRQVTLDEGWRVSDLSVAEQIKSSPQFQVNGRFNKARYEQLLKTQRLNKPGYEALVRQGLQLDQLRSLVDSSGFMLKADRKQFLELQSQQRAVDYLVLDRNQFGKTVSVGDDEIKAYYEKNGSRFMTPERVKLEYLELNRDKMAEAITVDDAEIQAAYERDKAQYKTPESRKASHILIKLSQTDSDEAKKAAAEKAQSVYEKLKGGLDFAAAAKQYSDDMLSRDSGGSLGSISRGDMPKAFETKLFGLNPGEISEPVKTSQGYEIIRLDEIKGGQQKSFDDVRAQILADIRMREVDSRFNDLSDQLVTLTYENPETLDIAAEDLGLKIQETDWVTRQGGKGIAADPKILKAAFSSDVLDNRQNSELIELDDGSAIVIRAKEYKPAAPKPLSEVKDQITQILRNKKLAKLVREKGEALLHELAQGNAGLATVAGEIGATLRSAEVDRKSSKLAPELTKAIFTMPKPLAGKIAYKGVPLRGGNYALVALKKVMVPTVTDDMLKDSPEIARLIAEYNDRYYQALYKAVESRQDIEVFTDKLE